MATKPISDRARILAVLKASSIPLTTREIANQLHLPAYSVTAHLSVAVNAGLVKRAGKRINPKRKPVNEWQWTGKGEKEKPQSIQIPIRESAPIEALSFDY